MDKFQTIGAILAIALLLFQLFAHIPKLRRAFSQFVPWLKKSHRKFKEWRYWQVHRPKCQIISSSPLYVKDIDLYNYNLEVDVTIEFKNQDEYSLEFITSWFIMEIENNDRGIDERIYKLHSEKAEEVSTLPNAYESITKDFKFKGGVHGRKPSLPSNPKCRITMPGVRHPIISPVRGVKTNFYQLKVEWLTS